MCTGHLSCVLTFAVLSVSSVVGHAEAGVAAELVSADGVLVAAVVLLLTLVDVDTDPQLLE